MGISAILIAVLWLIVEVAIVIGIYWVGQWFIGWVGAGDPWPKILKLVIGVVILVIVVYFLIGLIAGEPGLVLPRR